MPLASTDEVVIVPEQCQIASVRDDVVQVIPRHVESFTAAIDAQRIVGLLLLSVGSPSSSSIEAPDLDVDP
jgi:hypothetical protein